MTVGVPPRTAHFRIVWIGGTIPVLPRTDGRLFGSTLPVAAIEDIYSSTTVRHGIHIGGTIPILPRTDGELHDQNAPAVIESTQVNEDTSNDFSGTSETL